MYRYEVTASVNTDFLNLTGKTLFYEDDGKWYVDSPNHLVQVSYVDPADQQVLHTFDQICQELYSSDFAANSTQHLYEVKEEVHIANEPVVHNQKGTDPFVTMVTHNLCDNTTWPATDDSEFIIEPSTPTKKLLLKKAEVQFSHDVQFATKTPTPCELYFETWAYNPLFDSGSPVDPDDRDFVPGVSSGNPLRFMVEYDSYKDLGDVFDLGNEHSTMNATVDGIPGMTTVHFNYDQIQPLLGSLGVQVRFRLKDNVAMGGYKCTVAIVVSEVDE